jgi:excisionase family DNA binding protein
MTARAFLTVQEFCDRYAVSRSTYYRLVANGDLSPVHIGRAVRIRSIDADTWATSLANDN